MSKLKVMFGFMLAISLIAGLAVPLCPAAVKDSSQTNITGLHLSVKGNRTCLIFDAEGAKPKQIGPASPDGISVFFAQITAKIPDRVIDDRKSAAKEIKFRRESGFFEVLFREKNASVSSSMREGQKGRYTLTLELTPSRKVRTAKRPLPIQIRFALKSPRKRSSRLQQKRLKPPSFSGPKQLSRLKARASSTPGRQRRTSRHSLLNPPRNPRPLPKPTRVPAPFTPAPTKSSKAVPGTSYFAVLK